MSREIKFRGKQIDNGEWVYGYLADEDYINDINSIDLSSIEVDRDTVGQFTGVKHNDREIYEHDLVECAGVLCEIVYNDNIGAFVLLEALTQNLGNKPIGQMIYMFGIRYVGNIHDHYELIKKE